MQTNHPKLSATCHLVPPSGFLVFNRVEGEVWVEAYSRVQTASQVLVVNFDFPSMENSRRLKGSKQDDEVMHRTAEQYSLEQRQILDGRTS